MGAGNPVLGSLYIYAPNNVAPVIFTIAFAVSAVGHIWQCYHYRCFKLIGIHPLCAVLFAGGYVMREYGAFNYIYSTSSLIGYIVSQVLINICPPLLELSNYHILSRVFYYVPYFAPFPPGKVLSIFECLMMIVEGLNGIGVSLTSNRSSNNQGLGAQVTVAALAIQIVVIANFFFITAIFHRRCAKAKTHVKAVSTPLNVLYLSMTLILVRSIYRLVQNSGNVAVHIDDLDSLMALSPALRYEWYFYVFDATLMLINSVLWNMWNPGRYLPRNYLVYLAQDGKTELEGKVLRHGRPLLSLLTFGMCFREEQEYRPFLELSDHSTLTR